MRSGDITMPYYIQESCEQVDWQAVYRVLQEAGLASHSLELTKKAFENSQRVVFVFDQDVLIGTGRAISDGAYEAAVYDIAVLPAYQGKKIGKLIMDSIHKGFEDINVILFARPGVENFYKKLGYCKMLTAMARFHRASIMREKGFTE